MIRIPIVDGSGTQGYPSCPRSPRRLRIRTASRARCSSCTRRSTTVSPRPLPPVESLRPMTLPGLSSTGLLLVILSWNEAFWSLNLTSVNAAPLPVFIASYSSPEGLFWAKLSAASFLAVAPIMVLGWMTQKQLVRGLTFGAVK